MTVRRMTPKGLYPTMIVQESPRARKAGPLAAAVTAILLMPALAGCMGGEKDLNLSTYVEQTDPADQLYNQGLANLNAGRLKEASRKFESVDRQHPYSEYARKALVMGAFTNYRQGQYTEAITASRRYLTLYPSSEEAAYAQYIIGLSYFRQIRDVTQDQGDARRTIEAMNEVVQRWPDSEYVEDAKQKIRMARDQLAGKEMQVGRYYMERKEYVAAVRRFRNVVEAYSNTRHVEEALARLTETYYAMGLTSEAQAAAAVLGHNFPDSPWYKDSYALLQKGGLEPREDRGSWLDRAAKTITGRA
ncbi:MAG: outer membrane protein assembly factor BamD [Rhizobiaceae bacterium]